MNCQRTAMVLVRLGGTSIYVGWEVLVPRPSSESGGLGVGFQQGTGKGNGVWFGLLWFPNHRAIRRPQDGAPGRLGLVEENRQRQGPVVRASVVCGELSCVEVSEHRISLVVHTVLTQQ
jgi:hypothetical protein